VDWRGAVALILASCVGVAYAVALVVAVLNPDRLSAGGSALLYVMGGALVGGVITYLGGKSWDGERNDRD
jgi:hypothetical protein